MPAELGDRGTANAEGVQRVAVHAPAVGLLDPPPDAVGTVVEAAGVKRELLALGHHPVVGNRVEPNVERGVVEHRRVAQPVDVVGAAGGEVHLDGVDHAVECDPLQDTALAVPRK